MSLILEALKKSEKERQEKSGSGTVQAVPVTKAGPRLRRRWVVVLAALPVLAFVIGGVVGVFRLVPAPEPAATAAEKAAAASTPTPTPAPVTKQPETATSAASQPTAKRPEPAAQQPAATVTAAPELSAAAPMTPGAPDPAAKDRVATAPASPSAPAAPAQPERPESAMSEPPAGQPKAAPQGRLGGVAVLKKKPAAPRAANAVPLGASEAQVLTRRGRAYEDKGLNEQAIATYSQAIDLDPGFADAYFGRGWARMAKGAYGDAADDFRRMIALRPDAADAYFGHAWALEQRGDREQAIRRYGEAIRLQPGRADAYFSRGVLEFMAGRMQAAARDFAAVHERASGQLKDYALLWRHVSQARGGVVAPTAVFDDWRDDDPWPGILVKLFRGEATPDQVLIAANDRDATRKRENECIALFFLGQHRLIAGDAKGAADYFRRTLATGVTYYRQHAAAGAELKRLENRN